ncbi:MAG TPA: hypothetical protein VEF72_32850 [Mycobacterium sp.]|nr:hypothetical protein [Mycobacterium sp.]
MGERSPYVLAATLMSFGVVFLAELGDRSQLTHDLALKRVEQLR